MNSIDYIWLSANKLGFELLNKAIKMGYPPKVIFTLKENSATKMYDGIPSKKWEKYDIPVIRIERINESLSLLKKFEPDLIISCGWRQIIDKNILNFPDLGVIGFHPTLLPKGRGPAPLINTILTGFKYSGLTMFYMNEGMDSGDIIAQEPFKVNKDDYAYDLYHKMIQAGLDLIADYLPKVLNNDIKAIPQNEKDATYFPKRSVRDNEINLHKDDIDTIYKKIRAFSDPYLGAYIKQGDKKLIIKKAEIEEKNE